jgi:glycosyltransferase involved in cell wall biosynthesis
MRLLVVTSSFPRHPHDHAGRFVLDLSLGLAAAGESVAHVVPFEEGCSESEDIAGMSVSRFRYGPRWLRESLAYGDGMGANLKANPLRRAIQIPSFLRSMRRAVKEQLGCGEFDCILSHWLVPAAWASAVADLPRMAICHGGDIHALSRWPLGGRILASIMRRTQHVFFVSEDLRGRAEKLLARQGVPMPENSVVPMGVDTGAFGRGAGESLRSEWGVQGDGRKVILGVGRLVHLKGFDCLIRAAVGLRGAKVVLVGEGPERRRLEDLARVCDVSVIFRGHQSPEALPDHFAAADIVCIPSRVGRHGRAEGHPMVLAEAMASGTAVVGARSGGLAAALDGRGVLFQPDDETALRLALQSLIDDDVMRARMSEEARQRAPEFDRARVADAVRKVGYNLING